MRVEIFIVTYARDLPYLELNLRTIVRFARGFSGVTVVVPSDEFDRFAGVSYKYGARLRPYIRDRNPQGWHLEAQCQKCWADGHCEGADFILHTDSDCVFTEDVTPGDYFNGTGNPVMLYKPYALIPDSPWKSVVESVLGHPVEFEFMQRHPQVNPVGIYSALRLYIEKLHKMEFSKFVKSVKPDFPWGFTEHNVIGAFAWYNPQWHDHYSWHDVSKETLPKEKLMQFWSHSEIDKPQEISHGGRYTPRDYVRMILKR